MLFDLLFHLSTLLHRCFLAPLLIVKQVWCHPSPYHRAGNNWPSTHWCSLLSWRGLFYNVRTCNYCSRAVSRWHTWLDRLSSAGLAHFRSWVLDYKAPTSRTLRRRWSWHSSPRTRRGDWFISTSLIPFSFFLRNSPGSPSLHTSLSSLAWTGQQN